MAEPEVSAGCDCNAAARMSDEIVKVGLRFVYSRGVFNASKYSHCTAPGAE